MRDPHAPSAETATTVTLSMAFYKRSVDGVERISLIPTQRIRRINGIDQYVGQAVPSIIFSGEVYTDNRRISISPDEWGVGTRPVRELSSLGDAQAPQLLISGIGEILGY